MTPGHNPPPDGYPKLATPLASPAITRRAEARKAPSAFKADSSFAQRLKGATEGRAFSGRGELRYVNHFLKAVIIALLIGLCWSNYAWLEHSNRLADQQYIVFHDRAGATSSENVAQFRTGPSDEEIRHQAWEVIRWVLGAGSSNADTAFAEAAKLMTPEMKNEFTAAFGNRRVQLKDLHIYKQLEEVKVAQLTADMLAPGTREAPTRYDILVDGTIDTYREGTQEKIATGPFAYHVHLVPLDRRTVENPYGLLISGISQVDLPAAQHAAPGSEKQNGGPPRSDTEHQSR